LNSDSATKIATTGAGSPGNETTYYGALTKAAVVKFQEKYASEVLAPYGLTKGTGYFGATSRAKANALIAAGAGTGTGTTCPTEAVACVTAGYNWVNGVCSCTGTGTGTGTIPAGFSIALASTNPAAGTLVAGQSIADLMEFTINNGTSSEAKITSIELTRLGISADATLSNVYLFDGTTRITDAATISSGKVTFNNSNGVVIVPANTAKTISVRSDILAATQGQTVGIALSGVTSNATLSSTSLPLAGNIHGIAQANLATATFQNVLPGVAGTTSDPMDGVRVWEAQLVVGIRSVVMSRLTLQQINSIDSKDIKNFKLYIDGAEVATVDSLDANRYLTFNLTKTLSTGLRTVKVLADITGGSGRNVQFSLRNKADVEVKDAEYNVAISAAGLPAATGTIAINPGAMQVTKSTSSFSGKVPNNSTNVSLAKYTFKAYGEPIKVNTLTFGFAYTDAAGANNGACTLRNGKVYVNGAQVGSTADVPEAGHQFATNFTVQPGETVTVEFYADIFDADGNAGGDVGIEKNDQITVSLLKEAAANAEKLVSYGGLFVPANNSPANLAIVSEGTLTLVKTTAYPSQNIVVPQTNYKIGSWDLIGSSVEDVNISSFTVDISQTGDSGDGLGDFDKDNLTDVYLVYGGTQTAIKPTVNATNDWTISTTIAKNQTMKIELYAGILETGVEANDALRVDLTVAGTGALSSAIANKGPIQGQITTVKNGAFIVTRDASTPDTAIVDDSGTVRTYSLKFAAQNDSYVLGEISLELNGVDSSAAANVILKDGSTVLATQPAAEDGAGPDVVFSGLQVPVNANTTKVLDVEVETAPVGYGAGTSGAEITVDFVEATVKVGSSGGLGSVASGVVTDSTVAGNTIRVYKAIPTISLVSLPSTVLSAGEKTLSKFTIATNGTGTVSWKKIVVDVAKSSTGVLGPIFNTNTVKLYNADTNQLITSAVAVDVDCNDQTKTSCKITLAVGTDADDSAEEVISGSKTYEIRATIAGTIASNDYITTRVNSSGLGWATNDDYVAVSGTAATFIWSDMSVQNHSTAAASTDWINDNLVKNIPLSSQTLTK